MANFNQSLAVFFLFFIFWCVISVNCGRFHQITHRNQHLYHHRGQNQIFWRDSCQIMRENAFWAHIAQYLKITPYVRSEARNALETSNLDQRCILGVSRGLRRDFWNFDFLPHFWALQAKKLQFFRLQRPKNGVKIKVSKFWGVTKKGVNL